MHSHGRHGIPFEEDGYVTAFRVGQLAWKFATHFILLSGRMTITENYFSVENVKPLFRTPCVELKKRPFRTVARYRDKESRSG